MDVAVKAMYLRNKVDSVPQKNLLETMSNALKESYKKKLKNLDWLDRKTQMDMTNKIDLINSFTGNKTYKDYFK